MPYKDPEVEKTHSRGRQRTYRKKPGVAEAYAARMRKLREDPAFKAQERVKQKARMNDPELRPVLLKKERDRKKKRKDLFDFLKLERGCYDCGGMFPPEALDWDHLPGTEKSFVICKYLINKPVDQVLAEIAKCQLVCATCHRIRSNNRRKEKL